MEIVKRKLTQNEAESFFDAVKRTPNITGYTVAELLEFDEVFLAEESGRVIGIAASFDIGLGWSDFAYFFVNPESRGSKIGTKLFEAMLNEARIEKRQVYISTRTPETIHLAEKAGFQWIGYRKIPSEIRRSNLHVYLSPYRIGEYIRKVVRYWNLQPFRYGILVQK